MDIVFVDALKKFSPMLLLLVFFLKNFVNFNRQTLFEDSYHARLIWIGQTKWSIYLYRLASWSKLNGKNYFENTRLNNTNKMEMIAILELLRKNKFSILRRHNKCSQIHAYTRTHNVKRNASIVQIIYVNPCILYSMCNSHSTYTSCVFECSKKLEEEKKTRTEECSMHSRYMDLGRLAILCTFFILCQTLNEKWRIELLLLILMNMLLVWSICSFLFFLI